MPHICTAGSVKTHHVSRIVDVSVSAELGLDVLVAQQPHLGWKVLSVGTQEASVEVRGRQEGHLVGPETAAGCCRDGCSQG